MSIPGKSNPTKPAQTPGIGNPAPGDEAPPFTPGTGENLCPDCHGTGRIGDQPCPSCGGTGKIIEGIGGG
jgi:DnaJ-class molecular chaperone